ncbi:polyprotein [Plasmopara halstedii]|uniref:Polyprotein n=1 Tax=Plasmopara halstedii TaxID=4781 RepID=A0A0P1ALW1_PLAHL|nr:polyprotein [Plasmopara halstedii]CEG42009.1 polyprotein [Plasmopara halstedii]|eukprot:XP_024578378.1 polyprotein [Plasmopara halstedii]
MDHLRVFASHGYAYIDDVKRTKLEPKSFKCMFIGYAENVKGYRVFDLENAKIKVTRSVRLGEREVGGIYDTQEGGYEVKVQHQVDRQPVLDDPMEAVEKPIADVEMDDMDHAPNIDVQRLMPSESPVQKRFELTEYHQPTQCNTKIVWNCSDDEESAEGNEGPQAPKRARIDEDGLVAEAVLAYAVSIDDDMDLPSTYAQAMASDDAIKWREAIDAELCSHEESRMWRYEERLGAQLDHDANLPRNVVKMAMSCDTRHDKLRKDSNKSIASTFSRLILRSPA